MQAFIEAVSNGDIELVRSMLAVDPSLAMARTESGETVIQRSVYWGKSDVTHVLLEAGPKLDFGTACTVGDRESVLQYLATEPDSVHRLTPDGFTPLCLAVAFGHTEIAENLIAAGADVEARSTALGGVSPIHAAVFGRNLEGMKLLLSKGADANAPQEDGFTALHGACQNGDPEMVALLLRYGADPDLTTGEGKKPIDLAPSEDHGAMRALIEPASRKAR